MYRRWTVFYCVVLAVLIGRGAAAEDADLRRLVKALAARLDDLAAGQERDRAALRRLEARVADGVAVEQVNTGVREMRLELQQLAEHIRTEATVADQLVEMRSEIDSMSSEVQYLKERVPTTEPDPGRQARESTVLHWLQDMVTMLRGQMADLAESFNATQLTQLQQTTDTQFELVRGEMRTLADSVQSLRARCRSDRSQLTQLRSDLTELLAKSQDRENTYATLLDEVSTMRKEFLTAQIISPTTTTQPPSQHQHRRREATHRRRHHRHGRRRHHRSRFHRHVLEDIVDVLYKKQAFLDDELQTARRNVTSLAQRQLTMERQLEETVVRAEQAERDRQEIHWRLNVTNSKDNLRAIQTSTRELIREVEDLETKVDARIVEVKRELSRLDVSYGQLTISAQEARDEQKAQAEISRKLKRRVSSLSQQQDADRAELMALQAELLTHNLECARPPLDAASDSGRGAASTSAERGKSVGPPHRDTKT